MKTIVIKKHGSPDMLELREVAKPSPKEHEVMVKVHAATVTQGDIILRKLHPLVSLPMQLMGIKQKKVPGHEFAGEVVELGLDTKKFKVGEKVFGTTTGLRVGATAEYLCLPEQRRDGVIAIMTPHASFKEAAGLPIGGMTALEILQRGNILPGQRVLIYGASGSVGSYATQIAKHHFKAHVTGVSSTNNLQLVKSLGADQVLDYTKEEFSSIKQPFDVVFDAVGKLSQSDAKKILKQDGTYLSVRTTTKESEDNLATLMDLFEQGKIRVVIDSLYPIEQVPDAHRKVETGHKVGNVIISIIPDNVDKQP